MSNGVRACPKSFGPFDVLAKLGRGAVATVYKVRHKETGAVGALKVGPQFLKLDPSVTRRFELEFTMIRPLQHPNLVQALAIGEQNDYPYILLEYVPGQNLQDMLTEKGPLPPAETVNVFLQVAEGLRYLHSHNLLHRDIKPSNIFLTPEKQAKLGDFGLLKNLTDDDSKLTLSRQSLGTIEYGAPEQFEDAKRVDCRCDLYSFGATLYTALTGKFPFGNGGQMQILQRKLLNQFVPLRLLMSNLDPAIDRLVNRCLHPDASMRPNHCGEVLTVLREFRPDAKSLTEGDVPHVQPGGGPERRTSVRFAVDLTATFVPFHQNMRGRWDATILDVSPMGVRLQTPREVAINSVVHLTLGQGARTELALVKWVKPGKNNTQIVGCSFVHPLTTHEFKALYVSALISPGKPIGAAEMQAPVHQIT